MEGTERREKGEDVRAGGKGKGMVRLQAPGGSGK